MKSDSSSRSYKESNPYLVV